MNELATATIGGVSVIALIISILKSSASRNIGALDETIKSLGAAVSALSKEIQALREANVGLAKDVGALQAANIHMQQRIDGQATYWQKQFEEYRQLVHDRLDKATRDMIDTVEQVATAAKKGRR